MFCACFGKCSKCERQGLYAYRRSWACREPLVGRAEVCLADDVMRSERPDTRNSHFGGGEGGGGGGGGATAAGGGVCGGGGIGGKSSPGTTQDERSKNKNSSALPWGDISVSRQPVGKGMLGLEVSPPVIVPPLSLTSALT